MATNPHPHPAVGAQLREAYEKAGLSITQLERLSGALTGDAARHARLLLSPSVLNDRPSIFDDRRSILKHRCFHS